jgi:hypothetical protein
MPGTPHTGKLPLIRDQADHQSPLRQSLCQRQRPDTTPPMPAHPDYYPDDYAPWLLKALEVEAAAAVAPDTLGRLRDLQDAWVHGHGELADDYFADPLTRRAYALFYMSTNMPKLWFILDRCPALLSALATRAPLRVIDAGAGPGTMTWALLFYLQARCPELLPAVGEVVLREQSSAALALARRLADDLRRRPAFAHLTITAECDAWQAGAFGRHDLVLLGNVLNEGRSGDTGATLAASEAAATVIVEPGTRSAFSECLSWRESLLAAGWSLQFPCPSAGACPMAADNWCHFHVNRFTLPLVQRMAAKAGRLKARHHFCGFALANGIVPAAAPSSVGAEHWRVLSTCRRQNRSAIRYLCDGRDVVEVVLNRRDKTAENRDFVTAAAGDCGVLIRGRDRAAFVRQRRLRGDDTFTIAEQAAGT